MTPEHDPSEPQHLRILTPSSPHIIFFFFLPAPKVCCPSSHPTITSPLFSFSFLFRQPQLSFEETRAAMKLQEARHNLVYDTLMDTIADAQNYEASLDRDLAALKPQFEPDNQHLLPENKTSGLSILATPSAFPSHTDSLQKLATRPEPLTTL